MGQYHSLHRVLVQISLVPDNLVLILNANHLMIICQNKFQYRQSATIDITPVSVPHPECRLFSTTARLLRGFFPEGLTWLTRWVTCRTLRLAGVSSIDLALARSVCHSSGADLGLGHSSMKPRIFWGTGSMHDELPDLHLHAGDFSHGLIKPQNRPKPTSGHRS